MHIYHDQSVFIHLYDADCTMIVSLMTFTRALVNDIFTYT
jgi:hypothetical protein